MLHSQTLSPSLFDDVHFHLEVGNRRGEMDIDENVRASFQLLTPEPIARAWKALARGASAEGLPYAATRFVTPPVGAGVAFDISNLRLDQLRVGLVVVD